MLWPTRSDSLGVQKGDRVALLLPNSPPYVIGYYAILKMGAIVVNLNPLSVERELLYLLNHAEAQTIIVAEPLFPAIAGIAPPEFAAKHPGQPACGSGRSG